MMKLPVIGVQFYKLLDCAYCSGTWAGWIVYLLCMHDFKWQFFILFGLAGGTINLILDAILYRLNKE
jgi:hypothetical protein